MFIFLLQFNFSFCFSNKGDQKGVASNLMEVALSSSVVLLEWVLN